MDKKWAVRQIKKIKSKKISTSSSKGKLKIEPTMTERY